MKTFKQFLKEEENSEPLEWKNKTPRGMEEHDEVNFQLKDHNNTKGGLWHEDVVTALNHLSNKDNFNSALENAKKETRTEKEFENIGNHEVGKSSKELSKSLEPGKWERAKTGKTPPGILLRVTNHETGKEHQHALAGASNMAVTGARNRENKTGENIPVLVIDHHIGQEGN